MARREARIYTGVWGEPDWRQLSAGGQWLYFFLISQPDLAHDGVISLRERRWAQNAQSVTAKDIRVWLEELERGDYVVVDTDTEEVLVRSFIRGDQVYLQPNLMTAALAHLPGVESRRVRHALWIEITRIIREHSDRARTARGEALLTEKQKAPIRAYLAALKASGAGPRELDANPSGRPGDDLRSSSSHPTRPAENDLRSSENDLRSNLGAGLGRDGLVTGLGHSDPVDPLRPAEVNPSGKPTPNPLGDRGNVTVVSNAAPIPYPLTPTPYRYIGHSQDQNSLFGDEDVAGLTAADDPNRTDHEPINGRPVNGQIINGAVVGDPLLADFGPTPTPEQRRTGAAEAFQRFWDVYPLKVKRGYAESCWKRAITKATPERIIAGARRYAADPNRDPAFTAHPSSWLNQGRWDDDPLPARGNGRPAGGATQGALDAVARRRANRETRTGGEITDGRR